MSHFSFDVFFSYSHKDRDFARQMVSWLRQCGFRIWIDEEQLVPGSRFRAGLQQGLRESRHMVALLTSSYYSRPWTQRELDLFDMTADHSERRLLAVEVDKTDSGVLDQAILVHQRIPWPSLAFDPEGFWKLYCGLTGRRPGPRDQWAISGRKLIESTSQDEASIATQWGEQMKGPVEQWLSGPLHGSTYADLRHLAESCIDEHNSTWRETFLSLRTAIRGLDADEVIHDLVAMPWALGAAELAAVISLALFPQMVFPYSIWPFVDLSCDEVANWFLVASTILVYKPAEIWFSWAVFQQSWDLLPYAAAKAPDILLASHLQYLAASSVARDKSFKEVEENYDYGIMITPWNHFHLAWLAMRLGDPRASYAHAKALCSTTTLGDKRTGRFLNRLTCWSIFDEVRSQAGLIDIIAAARSALGLIDTKSIPDIQKRLSQIWQFAKAYAGQRENEGGLTPRWSWPPDRAPNSMSAQLSE